MSSHYRVLKVKPDVGPDEIKKRFKKTVIKFSKKRPSKSTLIKFNQIKESYETLIDPQSRFLYDTELGLIEEGKTSGWREYYRDYDRDDLMRDLQYGENLLQSGHEIYANGFVSWIWVPIIIFFITLVLATFGNLLFAVA